MAGAGMTTRGLSPVRTISGTVGLVDPETWVLHVIPDPQVQTYNKVIPYVEFLTPYQHKEGGGITYMPEVGSRCVLANMSHDSNKWVVLAFGAAGLSDQTEPQQTGRPGFKINKPVLNPGDIRLSTRSGNEITVLNGGAVRIRSSGLAQRMYLPLSNLIRDFCERYELETPNGGLRFHSNGEDEPERDGGRKGYFLLTSREKTTDDKPIGELRIGDHGDETTLSLKLRSGGKTTDKVVINMNTDKGGNLTFDVKKALTIKAESVSVEAEKAITVKSKTSKITLDAKSMDLDASGGPITVKAGAMKISAQGVTISSGNIILGNGAPQPVVVASLDFILWMTSITAKVSALPPQGVPSLPVSWYARTTKAS